MVISPDRRVPYIRAVGLSPSASTMRGSVGLEIIWPNAIAVGCNFGCRLIEKLIIGQLKPRLPTVIGLLDCGEQIRKRKASEP